MASTATKTIRIPLVIDAEGRWGTYASGHPSERYWEWSESAARRGGNPLIVPTRHWITAEVPIPEVGEIAGKVEAA